MAGLIVKSVNLFQDETFTFMKYTDISLISFLPLEHSSIVILSFSLLSMAFFLNPHITFSDYLLSNCSDTP